MEAFPVAPELMQAFPVGALNLLVAVASTVAAQHGPEHARRLCIELAANDDLWRYIASRLGGPGSMSGVESPEMALASGVPVLELEQHADVVEGDNATTSPFESDTQTDMATIESNELASSSSVATTADAEPTPNDESNPEPPHGRRANRRRARANGVPQGDPQ